MMGDHGLHSVHPTRRMARLCLQYPWSVLWVLTMGLAACVVAGEFVPVVTILLLQAVIVLHSVHLDRERRKQ